MTTGLKLNRFNSPVLKGISFSETENVIEQNVNRNSVLGNTIQFIYDYSQGFGLNSHLRQFKGAAIFM